MDRRAFLKTSLAAAAGAVLTSTAGIPRAGAGITPINGSVFNQQVALNGFFPNTEQVIIQYMTLPGNLPNSYGNAMAIWQASQLPYDQAPVLSSPIQSNSTDGTQSFAGNLDKNLTYVVGYSTSAATTTVCSTLTFYPGRTDGEAFSTQIHPVYVGADSITVGFQTPTGNLPATNGNWVGIWGGDTPIYDGSGMLAKTKVAADDSQGTVAINGIPLLRSMIYTVGYFIGESNSDLAATFTMNT